MFKFVFCYNYLIYLFILDLLSVIIYILMFVVLVRGVRIVSYGYENWICLRVELYGYYLNNKICVYFGFVVVISK